LHPNLVHRKKAIDTVDNSEFRLFLQKHN